MAAGELGDLRAIQTVLPVIEWFLHRLGDEAAQEVFTAATRGQTGEMEDAELDALLARTHERVVGAGAALLDAMRERRRRTLTTIASVFGAFDAYVHHDLGVEPEVARRALLPPNHRPSDSQAKVEPDEKHQAVFLAVLRRETTAGELRSLDREAVLPQVDEPGAEAP